MSAPESATQKREWLRCDSSPAYFIHHYVQIYDATDRVWVPFHLWTDQYLTLKQIEREQLLVILKARQLGLTWLCLGYALWLMLFRPVVTVLGFSKRDDEAVYLLGDERLRGMYSRLPDYLRARDVLTSNDHEFGLSNGSIIRGFPTTAGDSYTASLVIVDEADLIEDLGRLMRSVKPTIDGGGQMILLSRADKSKPTSEFKNLYRAAKAGLNGWRSIFLPWNVRPNRSAAWYEAQRVDSLTRTGALDDLHEQYPATDTEALAPRSLDKRIPPDWLEQRYRPAPLVASDHTPLLPGLQVWALPQPGRVYVIGADPAEGNPTSDDSALEIIDADSGEEVAALAGRIEPSIFASYLAALSALFNFAAALVERNNHGHAVLLWLKDNSSVRVIAGEDGKPGWLDHSRGKALLYTSAADACRTGAVELHSIETFTQLQSIEGASLRAPAGQRDDRADAWALANLARNRAGLATNPLMVMGVDPLVAMDKAGGF